MNSLADHTSSRATAVRQYHNTSCEGRQAASVHKITACIEASTFDFTYGDKTLISYRMRNEISAMCELELSTAAHGVRLRLRFRTGEALAEAALGEELKEAVAAAEVLVVSGVLLGRYVGFARACSEAIVTGNHSQHQVWEFSVFFQHRHQTTKEAGGLRLRSRDDSMMIQLTRDVSRRAAEASTTANHGTHR